LFRDWQLPQIINYEVEEEGSIGREISRTGKKGIIRQIEAGFVLDVETAMLLRKWIDERLNLLEQSGKIVATHAKEKTIHGK